MATRRYGLTSNHEILTHFKDSPTVRYSSDRKVGILLAALGFEGNEKPQAGSPPKAESTAPADLRCISSLFQESINSSMLRNSSAEIVVGSVLLHGTLSFDQAMIDLMRQGCDRILLAPLYPQYSNATTGRICSAAFRALARLQRQPTIRVLAPYYAEDAYIDTLAKSVIKAGFHRNASSQALVLCFPGRPIETISDGDPYFEQCHHTINVHCVHLGLNHGLFGFSCGTANPLFVTDERCRSSTL
ncbi:ferrochelatase [Ensifer adhaerens]|uniref:ferrochelatase n=1 Tax=Ensifer adhaerens TaxID=106592 RepID=UPI001CC05649|nr:ferrochelatase [Ensifer adhaerens]MBZ7924797.1 ferrochelatase [Ensifer adhaerens]UAX95982.1 ferrochelatase [Ensifer adhaerens]UAY04676.1 ferrochelatase [Ensifer adhaerens]UAY10107.1 ferrochelatase [Ensifer adhaerens]